MKIGIQGELGAYSHIAVENLYKNVDIKIHRLKLLDPANDIHMENSGSIFKVTKDGLYIKTMNSKIVITHLQMPGKKVINKSDIYNAYSNYFE